MTGLNDDTISRSRDQRSTTRNLGTKFAVTDTRAVTRSLYLVEMLSLQTAKCWDVVRLKVCLSHNVNIPWCFDLVLLFCVYLERILATAKGQHYLPFYNFICIIIVQLSPTFDATREDKSIIEDDFDDVDDSSDNDRAKYLEGWCLDLLGLDFRTRDLVNSNCCLPLRRPMLLLKSRVSVGQRIHKQIVPLSGNMCYFQVT